MPLPGDQYRDTPATTNPFIEQKQHVTEYSAREIATLQSRLEKQLGPEYVSTRPGAGGGKVHYLAAEKAINLANEVFGFNGWSSSIQNVQIDFVDENPTNGKITLGLSTIVRVTIRDGTFHEDTGYGHIENCKGKAAAFEKAKKEAATDALKRALRNFGNVLGNCLYDKDYLQKVQRIKIAPSKWDAENLHRHREYAPIKRESLADATSEPAAGAGGVGRQVSAQSGGSFGSMEFEDDFGGNELDEADFSHPDEVKLDNTTTTGFETPAKKAVQNAGGQQRQGVPRMHSMPQIRPPNIQSPAAMQYQQAPQRPQGPPKPPGNAAQAPPVRTTQQSANNVSRPAQGPPQSLQNQGDGAGSRSNPSSATATDSPTHVPPQQANSEPRQPPPDHPSGFITGRGAALLDQPSTARPPNAALAFNPHAETPSIRRTHGVNPGKSAPIMKSALPSISASNAVLAAPALNAPAAQTPTPAPPLQQQRELSTNGLNGATTPIRNNYVNPSADPGRRIGMPPPAVATPGAVQNRGAYKPPAPAQGPHANLKRPPLSDVSNIQQVDGAGVGDVKKAKVGGNEGQAMAAGDEVTG